MGVNDPPRNAKSSMFTTWLLGLKVLVAFIFLFAFAALPLNILQIIIFIVVGVEAADESVLINLLGIVLLMAWVPLASGWFFRQFTFTYLQRIAAADQPKEPAETFS